MAKPNKHRQGKSHKSLTRILSEHPGTALTVFALAVGGGGYTVGYTQGAIQTGMVKDQEITDLKYDLQKRDLELITEKANNNDSALLSEHANDPKEGTGSIVQLTIEP